MNDIYKDFKIKTKSKNAKKDIYKSVKIKVEKDNQAIAINRLVKGIQKGIQESNEKLISARNQDIQKVEVINPQEVVLKTPELQKVEVTNPTVNPDVQKVEVVNPSNTPEIQKVEITNPTQPVEVQKVIVTNQVEKLDIPTGFGNIPGKANPEKYIPVRLTDGNKFYKALDEFYVSASKGGGGQRLSGNPITGQVKIAVTGTPVKLPDNALNNGVILKAKSTNTAPITVGGSAGLNNIVDGTGNGDIIEAGSATSYAVTNTGGIWVNGTSGDVVSFSAS